jgi:glucosamine--fructose-6-phosphate aminotransferase (isomerizing)
MVRAQPGAVRRALQVNTGAFDPIADRLLRARRVYLTACGTSFHACLVGEFALRWALPSAVPVVALQAFEFRAHPPPMDADTVVIAPSHSGETKTTNEALAAASRSGARRVVATMSPDSTAARMADDVLLQGKERDRSWVNTLSYTTQLAVLMRLALVAARKAGLPGLDDLDFALNAMPEALKQVLRLEPAIEALAKEHTGRDRFLFVGGGPNVATAYEAALKVKEGTYTSAEGWEVEQLLHGPIFAFDERYLAFFHLPPGPSQERGTRVMGALEAAGVATVAMAEEGSRPPGASVVLPMPRVPELLSPIPYTVPSQLFTYHSAVARGINPDPIRTDDPRYSRAAALLFES